MTRASMVARHVLTVGLTTSAVLWTGFDGARAQVTPPTTPVFAQLRPGNMVDLVDPVTGAGRTVYRSTAWSTTGLQVSPTGAYLGLLEVQPGVIEGVNYRVPPRAELTVLDTTGVLVRRVANDVVNYVWCGSACLAFIRGTYNENELHYSPTGAFVLDLSSGKLDSLPGHPYPHHLMWAPFDSSVYFQYPGQPLGRLVQRYHMPNGPLVSTSHRDLHFSLDGRYYLDLADSSAVRPLVYETRSDQVVMLGTQDVPERWLPSGGSHLLLHKAALPSKPARGAPRRVRVRPPGPVDVDYSVYDVETGRLVRSLHGHFPPWASPQGIVPFLSQGRISVIRRP